MPRGRKPLTEEEIVRMQVRIPASLNERLERYLDSPAARRGESKNSLLLNGLKLKLDQLEEGPEGSNT